MAVDLERGRWIATVVQKTVVCRGRGGPGEDAGSPAEHGFLLHGRERGARPAVRDRGAENRR